MYYGRAVEDDRLVVSVRGGLSDDRIGLKSYLKSFNYRVYGEIDGVGQLFPYYKCLELEFLGQRAVML